MYLIRLARPSDAEAIATLLCQLGHPSTPDHVRRQIARVGTNNGMVVLVAEAESRTVGVLALQICLQFHQEPPLARIVDLCVLDTHRGSHAGRSLIERAEEIAREKGCCKLEVTANNVREPAHRFYQLNGLEQTHRYFAKNLQEIAP